MSRRRRAAASPEREGRGGDVVALGVVAGDPLAPGVLATWRALGLRPDDDPDACAAAVADVLGLGQSEAAATIRRCRVAGMLLPDGGIAPAAESFVEDRLARGRPA